MENYSKLFTEMKINEHFIWEHFVLMVNFLAQWNGQWFSMEKPTNVFFGPGTIAPDGFSMVGNHWSNIGMVTNNDPSLLSSGNY